MVQVDGHVIREDSGAFAVTTRSLTMEVMAVSKTVRFNEHAKQD
jgi:hypothetical protein